MGPSLTNQLGKTRVFFNQFGNVEQSASLNLIRPTKSRGREGDQPRERVTKTKAARAAT